MAHLLETDVPLGMFKKILDDSDDGYMIADARGVVVYTNTAYLKVSDRMEDGMTGHNMREFIEDGSLEDSNALRAIEERRQVVQPLMIRNEVPLSVTSTPLFGADGELEYVVTVTQDISLLSDTKLKLDNLLRLLEKNRMPDNNMPGGGEDFVAVSAGMRRVFDLADKIKNTMPTVIVYGESGVGKDVVARYIHETSVRAGSPFISVNCGAIPEQILETELFGYLPGTFTGADKGGKKGLFEAADGGTLFLDEVGEMSPALQVKLLRVLETRSVARVGGHKEIPVDVRIIAATNKDLETMIRERHFRDDLFYRLNVLPLHVPPLRERADDIIPLSLFYLKKFNTQYNVKAVLSPDALAALEALAWPGNVRELRNMIERLVVTGGGSVLRKADIALFSSRHASPPAQPGAASRAEPGPQTEPGDRADTVAVHGLMPLEDAVASVERQLLEKAKREGRSCRKMAELLGVSYSTVARKLHQYNL